MSNEQDLYRRLPQIAEVLQSEECLSLLQKHPRSLVTMVARGVLAGLRREIQNSRVGADSSLADSIGAEIDQRVAHIGSEVVQATAARLKYQLQPVINATGVILQTNLGRAPLGEKVLQHVLEVAGGYCNLELDLTTGARGRRDDHAEGLLLDLLSAKLAIDPVRMRRTHAAAVVNNCAAATYLALNALAEGGEVIVSRGELVEIGGGFRIPEILAKSGAVLREVGTTNRTRIEDYRAALSAGTRMILRVHQSNFRIEGFTEQPSLEQLIALGAQAGVPVFEDQGTGCLDDLATVGLTNESKLVRKRGLRAGAYRRQRRQTAGRPAMRAARGKSRNHCEAAPQSAVPGSAGGQVDLRGVGSDLADISFRRRRDAPGARNDQAERGGDTATLRAVGGSFARHSIRGRNSGNAKRGGRRHHSRRLPAQLRRCDGMAAPQRRGTGSRTAPHASACDCAHQCATGGSGSAHGGAAARCRRSHGIAALVRRSCFGYEGGRLNLCGPPRQHGPKIRPVRDRRPKDRRRTIKVRTIKVHTIRSRRHGRPYRSW